MLNKLQKNILIYFLFAFLNNVNCQIIEQVQKIDGLRNESLSIKKTSDSLINKSFDELEYSLNENSRNIVLSKIYARAFISKAKKESDTLKIAKGYKFFLNIDNSESVKHYADSLISISKNLNHKDYPGLGYLVKGAYLFDKKEYESALDNYLIAQKYATERKNILHQVAIGHNIALLKKAVGGKKEAVKIFKKNLAFIKTQDTITKFPNIYIATLYGVADSYHRMNQPDSAKFYVDQGLYKSIRNKNQFLYNEFLLMSGINNNLKGNYNKALDSLHKALKRISVLENKSVNEATIYLQIAKALRSKNIENESLIYLKRIDSITTPENYGPEGREAFELLIDHYKKKKDVQNQLNTLNKLITMDSLFNDNNKNLKSKIALKYDAKKLIDQRNTVIDNLRKEKIKSRIGNIILVGVSILLIILTISYYRKQKKYKLLFNELIKTKNKQPKITKKDETTVAKIVKELDLSAELVNEILTKLEKFESDKKFLNSNIKMVSIAEDLNTNSTYFSKIINSYKKKNFNNYINDLRIDYCVEKLKSDSKFRKYSIKSIGEEVGFNNVQSFSRAFYKKTGLQPSYFLKRIESQ